MAKQQFNRRLSDEAITAITWWAKQDSTPARKVTDTEIVERAIAYYDEMRGNGGEIRIPDAMQGQGQEGGQIANVSTSGFDPTTVPGISRGPSHVSVGFPCRCVHSGCQGAKFNGASKTANICDSCRESGHSTDPRSCQECFNDTGPA